MEIPRQLRNQIFLSLSSTLFLGVIATAVYAQSLEMSAPTPVRSLEVTGTIAARDIGDARLTDHFYAFAARPGDLLITVHSKNLNGDIDVFTSNGLRPLLKFTIYAESSDPISKGVYLRKREDLILRVEARTPNDDEGTYEIRFGGSFVPAPEPLLAEAESPTTESPTPTARSGEKKVRRVSSVGARLPEPEPPAEQVVAAPTPEPSPSAAESASAARPAAEERPVEAEAPKRSSASASRSRRPGGRRRAPRAKPESTAAPVVPEAETVKPAEESATKSEAAEPPAPSKTRGGRASRKAPRASPAEPAPESGPRLIIQTNDGTLIERYMTSVRRVLVEGGQVVVVGKDGRVDRILLTQVVRMTIEQ